MSGRLPKRPETPSCAAIAPRVSASSVESAFAPIARTDDPYVRAREGSYYFRACEEPFPPRPSLAPRNSLAKGLSEFTDHPLPLLGQALALQAELYRRMQHSANDLDLRVQYRWLTIERVNLQQRLAIVQPHAEQPL